MSDGREPSDTGNESRRLDALRRYDILDSDPEQVFDDLARLAAGLCDCPVAMISFVDDRRQWFKSRVGIDEPQFERGIAFCAHAIEGDRLFQVCDAAADRRFRDNPLVTGSIGLRFYAGAPLVTEDGLRLGTLCVIDRKPRELSDTQCDNLAALSRQVMSQLELRRALRHSADSREELVREIATRRATEAARRLSDLFMRATIDSLPDTIAIIDRAGEIVHVNAAWAAFASDNSSPDLVVQVGPGVNYLDVCDRAAYRGSDDAARVAAAIRRIVQGDDALFSLEYPCHAPHAQRWFHMSITAFGKGPDRHAVVTHRNITERHLAEQSIRELNESLEERVRQRTADLRQAYATLHESESRFRSLFENARVGIVVADTRGRLERINKAGEQMSGRNEAALQGRNLLRFVHPDDRERIARHFADICAGRIPGCELEARNHPLFGSAGWLHATLSAVHDSSGNVAQVLTLMQDIAQIKVAERQRDRFFNHSLDMLVIAGFDGSFHRVNPACERILGYSAPELTSRNYLQLVHPDDRERARREIAALAGGNTLNLLDVRMLTKSGEYRDIRWNATPWTTEGLVLAVGRDVTSIRAAERALEERDMMLQRAEQMAQMGSWRWSLQSDEVRCSDGLLRIAGRPAASGTLSIAELLEFLHPDDRRKAHTVILGVTTGSEPARLICRLQHPDGRIRNAQSFIDVTRTADGRVTGVTAACLDVTELNETVDRLRRSEDQLRALSKRMEQVREDERASISREIHDELGQMLTALKIDVTLLVRDAGDEPDIAAMRTALESMSKLVDATIRTVRGIARQLRPEVLDALGLVPAIEWHASEFQARSGIVCRVSAAGEQPKLNADVRTALFRITQEALTNVARHAGAGHIDIAIHNEPGQVELVISDDGSGVTPETLFRTTSLGVLGMRERATMIDGTFDIIGRPDDGTTITVRVPVERAHGGAAE